MECATVGRQYVILGAVLSFLLLSGCTLDFGSSDDDGIVRGTRGLVIDFVSGTPTRLSQGEPYNIQMRLTNEGAFDIEDGVIDISYESQKLDLENRDEIERFSLSGDDGTFRGESEVKEIRMSTRDFTMGDVSQTDTKVTINSCYEYRTFFQESFCMDTNPSSTDPNAPCTVSEIRGGDGQGAPVVVQRVVPRIHSGSTGARVSFDIYLRDSGDGRVLAPEASERVCTGELTSDDFSRIKISSLTLSRYNLDDGDISCESHTEHSNEFNMNDERGYITCSLNEEVDPSQGTFTTPMTIELKYGYLQTAEQRLEITTR